MCQNKIAKQRPSRADELCLVKWDYLLSSPLLGFGLASTSYTALTAVPFTFKAEADNFSPSGFIVGGLL